MKNFIKQLFCKHKDIYYMYSENLSTVEITTTAEVELWRCKNCQKLILKY